MRYIDEKLTVGKNTKNTQKKKTKGFGYQVLGFGAGGGAPAFVEATGGTITESGNYKIHTFSSDGTFIVTNAGKPSGSTTVDYLVLAGGGGGGPGSKWGGAGAGGFRESANPAWTGSPLAAPGAAITVSAQSYPITVGAGASAGNKGNDSIFDSITSTGGGKGGRGGPPPPSALVAPTHPGSSRDTPRRYDQ